jgi:lactobin A/cerein 7B family class IIb bacteriocin
MLELEKFGLVEMSSAEVQEVDGGFFPIAIWGVVIGAEYVAGLFFAGVGIGCTVAATK